MNHAFKSAKSLERWRTVNHLVTVFIYDCFFELAGNDQAITERIKRLIAETHSKANAHKTEKRLRALWENVGGGNPNQMFGEKIISMLGFANPNIIDIAVN